MPRSAIPALIALCVFGCGSDPVTKKEPEWECQTTLTIKTRDDEAKVLLKVTGSATGATEFFARLGSESDATSNLCDAFDRESDRDSCQSTGGLFLGSIPDTDYSGLVTISEETTCEEK